MLTVVRPILGDTKGHPSLRGHGWLARVQTLNPHAIFISMEICVCI